MNRLVLSFALISASLLAAPPEAPRKDCCKTGASCCKDKKQCCDKKDCASKPVAKETKAAPKA